MSPRRTLRSRLLDLTVATVCVACVAAPLLPIVSAADEPNPSVVESGGSVDQRVLQSGMISNPINGKFGSGGSGRVDGSVQWDIYTSSSKGLKLVVSADRAPAMRDSVNGVDVADYGGALSPWSVSGSDRRFGFSVLGDLALSRFDDGKSYRGFDGARPVEIARRGATIGQARTTLKLRAEFGSALGTGASPTANIRATAVPNL